MNLKEAFQAQNKISELMSYINRYLSDADNVMTITEKHLRSKALAGQPDESVDASKKDAEAFLVDGLLGLWQKFMQERELLGQAIGKAKASMDFNLDAAVDANKIWGYKQKLRDNPQEADAFCRKCGDRLKHDFPEFAAGIKKYAWAAKYM